jgi:hypothetical protein
MGCRILKSLWLGVSLALPTTLNAQAQAPQRAAIIGSIIDSVHQRPLANAAVRATRVDAVPETAFTAVTDSRGRFRLDHLPVGRYAVTFESAFLDSIEFGSPLPSRIVGGGQTVRIDLGIPSGATLRALACPGVSFPTHTGVLQGILMDAETERRLSGAEIVVAWSALEDASPETRKAALRGETSPQRGVRVTTDSAGHYQLCGVPTDARLVMQVQQNGRAGAPISLVIADPVGVAVRNLSFSFPSATAAESAPNVSAARRTASLRGTVRTVDGQPVDRAEVLALHTDSATRTNVLGEFEINGLPAGTQEIEVRRIGFASARRLVELRGSRTVQSDVRLERLVTLDSMVTRASRYGGFEKRRQLAVSGRFVDEGEIDRWYRGKVNAVSDIVAQVAPLELGSYYAVTGQGSSARIPKCKVYADGVPTLDLDDRLSPSAGTGGVLNDISIWDVGAIEIYADANAAPLGVMVPPDTNHGARAFGKVKRCVILIWSKP